MRSKPKKRDRSNEKGQTIIESMLCIMLICLILFGLLQLFYLSVAQMITDYAAFSGSRTYSVGFADYLTDRSVRVASIAASGEMLFPDNAGSGSPETQFGMERLLIPEYIQGTRWLEYGVADMENPDETLWSWDDLSYSTNTRAGDTVEFNVLFQNYPLHFPMRGAFMDSDSLDLNGSARIRDHALDYLE